MIRGPRPLRDHVVTLNAYLNYYKNQIDPVIQSQDSSKFTCYLISTCWEKMVRWIMSWQAKYTINHIMPLKLSSLESHQQMFPSTVGPGAKTLMTLLCTLAQDINMTENVILHHCKDSKLSNFSLIFENTKSKTPTPVFSRDTILGFHKLTIAAFNGFAATFLQLKKANSKKLVGIV